MWFYLCVGVITIHTHTHTHTPASLTSWCITTHKHPYLTTELFFFVCVVLCVLRLALERTLMWAEARQLTTAASHAASGRGTQESQVSRALSWVSGRTGRTCSRVCLQVSILTSGREITTAALKANQQHAYLVIREQDEYCAQGVLSHTLLNLRLNVC